MSTFMIEIPANNMAGFQELMDRVNDENTKYIRDLAVELKVSEACAADVWYLRTRSRHTDELEKQLIALHNQGTPPNIMEYPS